eukprot:m.164523 g.164523  ORF g.164523 m.164523 type:complete len:1162 (-) comp16581_c0_seq14:34-3519(-)
MTLATVMMLSFGLLMRHGALGNNTNIDFNTFVAPTTSILTPQARIGASLDLLPFDMEGLLLVGGLEATKGSTSTANVASLGDIWFLNLRSQQWTPATPIYEQTNATILNRGLHACSTSFSFSGVTLGCFGGVRSEYGHNGAVNDGFLVQVQDGQLTIQPLASSSAGMPTARSQHTFTAIPLENQVLSGCWYLRGGLQSNQVLAEDDWVYCQANGWHKAIVAPSTSSSAPAPTYGHGAAVFSSHLVVFAGCQGWVGCSGPTTAELYSATVSNATGKYIVFWQRHSTRLADNDRTLSYYPGYLGGQYWVKPDSSTLMVMTGHDGSSSLMLSWVFSFADNWTETGVDVELEPANSYGVNPPNRFGKSLAMADNNIVVCFGGFTGINFLDETLLMSIEGRTWTRLNNQVHATSGFMGWAVSDGQSLTTFGGVDAAGSSVDKMWTFDYSTQRWSAILAHHTTLIRRGAVACKLDSNNYWLVGGDAGASWDLTVPNGQTLTLDLEAQVRTGLPLPGDTGRLGPVAVAIPLKEDNSRLIVVGGFVRFKGLQFNAASALSGVFTLDSTDTNGIQDSAWVDRTRGPQPSPRGFAVGVQVGNQVLVYGGYSPSSDSIDTTPHFLSLSTWTWTSGTTRQNHPKLFLSAFAKLGRSKVVVYGGLVPSSDHSWLTSSDLWLGELNDNILTWTLLASNQIQPRFGSYAATYQQDSDYKFLLLGGGYLTSSRLSSDPLFVGIRLGCPPGKFAPDFGRDPCQSCPLGTYETKPGATACSPCPRDSWTSKVGRVLESECSVCRPNHCARGRCKLDSNSRGQCNCPSGFSGDRCQTHTAAIAAGTTVGLAVVIALSVFVWFKLRKDIRTLRNQDELQTKLLHERAKEIFELEAAWTIQASEVEFNRRIDEGSEGAFGEVWQGLWQDRVVAVKQLRQSIQELDDAAVHDFDAEVKFMRTLRHANVVYFYGAGVKAGCPFLVTEFLERGALRTLLAKEEVPWEQRASLGLDAAHGMAYLHSLRPPRVHRDLKSANILVSSSWRAKVADFGTARLVDVAAKERKSFASAMFDTSTSLEMTGNVGTLLWCSPEILRAEPYSCSCDVYSYGIVMYEILTCKLPYHDIHLKRWDMHAQLRSGLRPTVPEDGDPAFKALMIRCWSEDPSQRPTFDEIVEELVGSTA